MIMSFWPMSLRVEENKKKAVSEHKAEHEERVKKNRRREGRGEKCLQSKTKGEQTNASLLEKQDNSKKEVKDTGIWGGALLSLVVVGTLHHFNLTLFVVFPFTQILSLKSAI